MKDVVLDKVKKELTEKEMRNVLGNICKYFNKETSLYVYGLITFIITQVIYFCFIYAIRKRRSEFLINLIIRIVLSLFALLLAYYLNYFDTLTVLALLYFVELVSNFIYSIALIKEDKKYFLFSLGLLLFHQ